MTLSLSERDTERLVGNEGPALALAMRVITRVAEAMEADRLLDVVGAHIDSCLFTGMAALDLSLIHISEPTRPY